MAATRCRRLTGGALARLTYIRRGGLEVRFDKFRVRKHDPRIFKDVDLYNIVAVLPGKRIPEAQVLVTAHYDSLNLGNRPLNAADYEKNAELPAPGACDDASGMAAVMELARVMSQYEFDKTLVFIAFAGEEQGLVGGALEAAKMKKENQAVEAVLNNDLIGTDVASNGRTGNSSLSVGKADTYTLPDVSIDNLRFGVKAIGNDAPKASSRRTSIPPGRKSSTKHCPS